MRLLILFLSFILSVLQTFSHDFSYTYEGQTLVYTVIDEDAKIVETKSGYFIDDMISENTVFSRNNVSGALIIPSIAKDGDTEYTVTSLGYLSFCCCEALTSVVIPNSVTSIGELAFYYCGSLTSVEIPNSVTSIGSSAFSYCEGLTSVTIPNSVTSIGMDAFSYCKGLTSVTIPNSVTSIGSSAFSYCKGLTSVTIPNSVTSIGSSAFSYCIGLTSVTIPNSVTSIGNWAFSYCIGLTSVTIPNSVTSIGEGAFYGCESLTSIEIPNSVSSIGEKAFYQASNLKYIKVSWENCIRMYDVFDSEVYPNATLDISGESLVSYLYYLGGFTHIIYNGITVSEIVSDDIFQYRLIENPDNREAILVSRKNSSETQITIPEHFIDERDTNDPVVYTVTTIGSEAFAYASLYSVEIPNSVTTIGASAFQWTKLSSVEIPNSVTTIGGSAFADCYGLTTVTIGKSVSSIGSFAFAHGDDNINLTIYFNAENCTYCGGSAFGVGTKEIIIGDMVKSIPPKCFSDCRHMTSVQIGKSVESIGDYAFQQCFSLRTLHIPGSVTSIGNNAFKDCNILTSVYYETVNPISGDTSIFSDRCYSNSTLYVPASAVAKCKEIDPWKNFQLISHYYFSSNTDPSIDTVGTAVTGRTYNLQGVEVENPTAPGIYIRDGKKFVVK